MRNIRLEQVANAYRATEQAPHGAMGNGATTSAAVKACMRAMWNASPDSRRMAPTMADATWLAAWAERERIHVEDLTTPAVAATSQELAVARLAGLTPQRVRELNGMRSVANLGRGNIGAYLRAQAAPRAAPTPDTNATPAAADSTIADAFARIARAEKNTAATFRAKHGEGVISARTRTPRRTASTPLPSMLDTTPPAALAVACPACGVRADAACAFAPGEASTPRSTHYSRHRAATAAAKDNAVA